MLPQYLRNGEPQINPSLEIENQAGKPLGVLVHIVFLSAFICVHRRFPFL